MKTISFMIEDEIADRIKKDAEKDFMTVSQYMRRLISKILKDDGNNDIRKV